MPFDLLYIRRNLVVQALIEKMIHNMRCDEGEIYERGISNEIPSAQERV